MVKCQSCANPATVHLTDIVNGQKKETHLCQACAEQQQLLKNQDLNLNVILQTVIGPHLGAPTDEKPAPDALSTGRLVAGIIRYQSDDRSEATAEYCFYAMNPKVLVACSGHNT